VVRKLSLLVIIAFLSTLAALNFGCGRSSGDDTDDGPLYVDLNDPKIKERLAQDDGYAFAIFYGGDIHGSLETCG